MPRPPSRHEGEESVLETGVTGAGLEAQSSVDVTFLLERHPAYARTPYHGAGLTGANASVCIGNLEGGVV